MQAQPVWPTSVLLVLYSGVVGHTVQLEAPAAEYSPAAQFEHTLLVDAVQLEERYLPAVHVDDAQAAQGTKPDADHVLPATQAGRSHSSVVAFHLYCAVVLQAQLELWEEIIEKKSAENPLFKEIVESQKAFAARATKWEADTVVSRRMAVNFFMAKKG